MTRDQIRALMAERKAEGALPGVPEGGDPESHEQTALAPGEGKNVELEESRSKASENLPDVDKGLPQYFFSRSSPGRDQLRYEPYLLGLGAVEFVDRKTRAVLAADDVKLILPLEPGRSAVDWQAAEVFDVGEGELGREPAIGGATWAPLPEAARIASSYTRWRKELEDHLYRQRRLEMFESSALDVVSQPGESERDFRIRLADLARSERDRRLEALRSSFATRRRKLEERVDKAERQLAKEKDQASRAKLETAVSIGTTLLSVLTGRRRLSQTTINRAGSSVRDARESSRQAEDVEEARISLEDLNDQLERLEQELGQQVQELSRDLDPLTAGLGTITIQPRRTDVDVRLVGLLWISD